MDTSEQIARREAEAKLQFIKRAIQRLDHIKKCKGSKELCDLTDQEILEGLNYSFSKKDKASVEQFDDYHSIESALLMIAESALSVELPSNWISVDTYDRSTGSDWFTPYEFRVLLCIGGPAVALRGCLDEFGDPVTASLEYCHWLTDWKEYTVSEEEKEVLLQYAQVLLP